MMDFLVGHSGFFFGVGIVVVLAVIGYYADKKDNEKQNKNNLVNSKSDSSTIDTGFTNYVDPKKEVNEPVDDIFSASNIYNDSTLKNSEPVNELQSNVINDSNDNWFSGIIDSSMTLNDALAKNAMVNNSAPSVGVNGNAQFSELKNNNVSNGMIDEGVAVNSVSNSVISNDNMINNSGNVNVSNDSVSDNAASNVNVSNNLGNVSASNNASIPNSDNSLGNGVSNLYLNNNVQTDVSNSGVKPFDASDFERLNISLADLEKKNYANVLANRSNDDENYYYSNIDDSNDVKSDANSQNINSNISESVNEMVQGTQTGESNQNVSLNNLDSNNVFDDFNNMVESISFDSDSNDAHLFDNETSSNNSQDYSMSDLYDNSLGVSANDSEQINEVDNSNSFSSSDDDSIPELSSGFNSNDSVDDIWKF